MPITTKQPQAIPTANEAEVTARANTEPATLASLASTISLLGGTDGARAMSVGFGFPFGISFATADNAGPDNIKPKIPTAVVKPITKDFRFDLGFSLASLNFFLKLALKMF